jgi:hypothetical protein
MKNCFCCSVLKVILTLSGEASVSVGRFVEMRRRPGGGSIVQCASSRMQDAVRTRELLLLVSCRETYMVGT